MVELYEHCFGKTRPQAIPCDSSIQVEDRSAFTVKELSGAMSRPTYTALQRLKRWWVSEVHTGLLGGPFLRACFFLRFEDQKRVSSLSYCFASIFIGLRLSRPALKPASKLALRCFVLIFMVSRHWSSRLALRPAFNFVSSYKLFVLLQYPSTWSLEAYLEAVPLRQLRPKILARQHSCQLLQVQPCWDFNNSII